MNCSTLPHRKKGLLTKIHGRVVLSTESESDRLIGKLAPLGRCYGFESHSLN